MFHTCTHRLFAVGAFGLAAASAHAVVIETEDFEGATGVNYNGTVYQGERADTDDNSGVVTDSTTFAGFGADNTFVRQETNGDNFSAVGVNDDYGSLDNGLLSFNFHFSEPTAAGQDTEARFYIGGNTGDRPVWLNFNNGTISPEGDAATASYLLDASYAIDVVANESGSTVTYNGSETVANESYDVYLTTSSGSTTQIFDDVAFQELGVNIDSFYFVVADGNQTFSHDSITITDDEAVILGYANVVVPEPASLALVGLGSLLICSRRRRSA